MKIKVILFFLLFIFQTTDEQMVLDIRKQFNRINEIEHILEIKILRLEESSEMGEMKLYYEDGSLVKITTINYGVLGFSQIDFYLKEARLFLIF